MLNCLCFMVLSVELLEVTMECRGNDDAKMETVILKLIK